MYHIILPSLARYRIYRHESNGGGGGGGRGSAVAVVAVATVTSVEQRSEPLGGGGVEGWRLKALLRFYFYYISCSIN